MNRFAVLSLHTPPVEIDENRKFSIVPDGRRYHIEPMTNGDSLAIFETRSEAESWIAARLEEVRK